MADPRRITITGPEFAVLVLHGHTQLAHVEEQTCTEPDCAAVRLLAEHPDDWQTMDVEAPRPECLCDLHDIGGFGPPKYIRGLSNGCQVHPASAGEQRMVAEREAIERARDEADRAAREAARRAE